MSTTQHHVENTIAANEIAAEPPTVEGWTPEDREPSSAENAFMSVALFAFLILFGLGCLIVF